MTSDASQVSPARWPRQVLFGDIDAMFASAAAVKDPALSGRPIAVGGPPGLYDQRRSKAVEAMDAIIARHGAVIGLGGVADEEE